jgi:hypothetical protein
MRVWSGVGVILLLAVTAAVAEEALEVGSLVYENDFEGDQALEGWSGRPVLGPGRNGGQAIFFEQPAEKGPGTPFSRLPIPVERLRGCVLNLSGWVRIEEVSQPPNSWNGVKSVTDGPIYRGHDLPRLRGAMVSTKVTPESLATFGSEWNANLIRWQLTGWRPQGTDFDLDAYDRWLEEQLALLDAALPVCRQQGLYVVVDLHSKPGGGPESDESLFNSRECQERFVRNWRRIAERYRDSEVVWGYDLANEPQEQAVDVELMDWQELAEAAGKAVREVDAHHTIIVEPAEGGNPSGFVGLRPIDVPNVVYSVHMYLPHAFTHQGVHGRDNTFVYPGEIGGSYWDKARLEEALKPVIDFQNTFRVHIYVGEFSAIRWAPDNSAHRYLRDCIEIFEERGWDWSYHAFREWSGWSVEHSNEANDSQPTPEPNDRQNLLRSWLAKNQKPVWK